MGERLKVSALVPLVELTEMVWPALVGATEASLRTFSIQPSSLVTTMRKAIKSPGFRPDSSRGSFTSRSMVMAGI